jgi:hypothetical protein
MANKWEMREEHFLEGNEADHKTCPGSLPANFQKRAHSTSPEGLSIERKAAVYYNHNHSISRPVLEPPSQWVPEVKR